MARISKRLLSRRSPPRVVTIEGGMGTSTPRSSSTLVDFSKIENKKVKRPPTPVLVNIQSLPSEISTTLPISVVTSVEKQPNQEQMPRISVPRRLSKSLTNKSSGLTSLGVAEDAVPPRVMNSGFSSQTRVERKKLSAAIVSDRIQIKAGELQVWNIPSGVSGDNIQGSHPVLRIDGDQVIRITFHRGAGGIIQDIEIPPDMMPLEISVPIGTKRFTLTGWGGQSLVPEGLEIGPATITSVCSTLNKTTVGFQRNSVINQIGPYRFLCRGGFIESDAAPTNSVFSERTSFPAREVLAKLDSIRFYTTRSIRTVSVVTKTRNGHKPDLHVEMLGIQPISEPVRVDRKDTSVHIWPVAADQSYEGPSIIEVITDEHTDVHSIMGNVSGEQSIVEMFSATNWSDIIEEGALSPYGSNYISWIDEVDRQISKSDRITIQKRIKESSTEEFKPQITEEISKPVTPSVSNNDLPVIEIPDGIAHELYTFDVSTFADDEDEEDQGKLQFSLIDSPSWVNLQSDGKLEGEPTNDDAGVVECIIRVTDPGGLFSDALVRFNIEEKQLNRAPFWNPNVRLNSMSTNQSKDTSESNKDTVTRRRRR